MVGYLQASRAGRAAGSADGRTDAISSAELLNSWGGPIYTGYLVVATSDPAQADTVVASLDPPTMPGAGLNIQNLAYAAQWWIFGGFAVLLWLRLVRDEARGSQQEQPGPTEPRRSARRRPSSPHRLDRSPLLLALHTAGLRRRGSGAVARRAGPGGARASSSSACTRACAASRLRSCERYSEAATVSTVPRRRVREPLEHALVLRSGWTRRCATRSTDSSTRESVGVHRLTARSAGPREAPREGIVGNDDTPAQHPADRSCHSCCQECHSAA